MNLSSILTSEGYRVTAFTSATQALAAMRQNSPNLVIIERKQAEEKIRDNAGKYRQFVEALQEGIWAIDRYACTTFVNPHMARMLGYTIEEMLGKPIFQFMDKQEVEKCQQFLKPRSQADREFYDFTLLRKDKSRIYITGEAVPLRDETDNYIGTLAAIIDITERKKIEEELLRLRTAVEQAVDGIAVADLDGYIQFVNLSWAKMHGYSVNELIGQHLSIFHTEEQMQKEVAPFNKQVLKIGFHEGEIWHVRKDGTTFPAWMTTALLRNAEQIPRGLIGMAHDITGRKKAEDERNRLIKQLRRSNTDLEQFAAIASHDLQEPLRTVNNFVQLLQKRYKNIIDAEANEYIDFIVDSAKRMQTLITDLLSLAKAGIRRSSPVMVATDAALNDTLKNINKAISESGAQISMDQLPAVWFERTELCQVFQNLIGNAIKFRRNDCALSIHIGARELENEWELSVSDNGLGFDPTCEARVFEPFQRLHNSPENRGSGIGLTICKKIIEYHGGRIWATSTPGHGSTFSFTVPKEPLSNYAAPSPGQLSQNHTSAQTAAMTPAQAL